MKLSRHTWIVLAVLAACAAPEAQWEKAGADEARMRQDSDECRDQARLAQSSPQTVQAPSRQVTTTALTTDGERALADIDHFQRCMRAKGYSAKR
jgi:hypothetical protein